MKILINRSDAIGDTILTMPMAEAIKQNYPESQIVFLVSDKSKDLFKNHPFIDDIWVYPHARNLMWRLKFLQRKMQEFTPHIYLYVGGTHLPTFWSWLMRIKFRGGLIHKWPGFLFLNEGIRQKRSLVEMHESEYNIQLLKPLKFDLPTFPREKYRSQIYLKQEQIEVSQRLLEKKFPNLKQPYIILHPGMTGHTLGWSPRNYARFIGHMEKLRPNAYDFLISHTPADALQIDVFKEELATEKYDAVRDRVFFYDGAEEGLRNSMGIMANASCFIAGSTGPTHIANGLGIPHIGIYSPIKVQSTWRWGPFHRNEKVKVIVPDVICGERFRCIKQRCPYYECMGTIEVEKVVKEATELIDKWNAHA